MPAAAALDSVEPPFGWRVLSDSSIPLLVEVRTDGVTTILSIEEDIASVLSGPELNECDLGELMADVARYEAGRATRYGEDVSPMQWERARVVVARLEAERDARDADNYDGPSDGDAWSGGFAENH